MRTSVRTSASIRVAAPPSTRAPRVLHARSCLSVIRSPRVVARIPGADTIPIKDDNTNQRVKTYNATIPTAVSEAAAAGKHVIFVDSYAAFVADANWKTKYMGDNLHPNEAGYVVLGQTWYAAIKDFLP